MEQTHLKLGAKPGSAKHQSTHRCMKKKYVITKIGMIMSFGWFVTQYITVAIANWYNYPSPGRYTVSLLQMLHNYSCCHLSCLASTLSPCSSQNLLSKRHQSLSNALHSFWYHGSQYPLLYGISLSLVSFLHFPLPHVIPSHRSWSQCTYEAFLYLGLLKAVPSAWKKSSISFYLAGSNNLRCSLEMSFSHKHSRAPTPVTKCHTLPQLLHEPLREHTSCFVLELLV